jgi:uncharacterized protein (TIGR03089 family)
MGLGVLTVSGRNRVPNPPTSKIASVATAVTAADTTLGAMTGSLLAHALNRALDRDAGRPFVTYYDDRTGERVELSVATLVNWVAKTANLVVDGLGLGPGDTVRLDLPRHWQLPVWALGAWTAGLTVDLDGDPATAQLAVCGPDGIESARAAEEVIALSLRPLGAPFPDAALPDGVLDYGREVAGYGDRFDGPGLGPEGVAVRGGGTAWTIAAGFDRAAKLAAAWGLEPGGRLLVADALPSPQELLAATLVPLAVGGSVVLCRVAPGVGSDATTIAARGAAERTSAVAHA